DTTGKIAKHVLVFVTHSLAYRDHVTRAAVFRIHRSENVIEQRSFFKLRILDIRMNGEETTRHLQHVVNIARLVGPSVHALRQLIRRSEVFVFAVSTSGVSVIVDNSIPKELGCRALGLLAGVDVLHQHSEHFWNLRIAMLPGELVFAAFERIEKRVVIEAM